MQLRNQFIKSIFTLLLGLVISINQPVMAQINFAVEGLSEEQIERLERHDKQFRKNCRLIKDKQVCSLRNLIENIRQQQRSQADVTAQDAGCDEIGKKEISYPAPGSGLEGNIIRKCQPDGTWRVVHNTKPITCQGGASIGAERTSACATGYSGQHIEECSQYGIWVTKDHADSCELNNETDSCNSATDTTRTLACPTTHKGIVIQSCKNNVWSTSSNECEEIKCDGKHIGEINEPATFKDAQCGEGFNPGGKVLQEICGHDGKWKTLRTNCTPLLEETLEQSSTCISREHAGVKENFTCPEGQQGDYYRVCEIKSDENYGWKIVNKCKTVTASCGEANIGSFRSSSYSCPSTKPVGKVKEICNADGRWELDYSNCTAAKCLGGDDLATNTTWENAEVGQRVPGNCIAGFGSGVDTILRKCSVTGKWGEPSASCFACNAVLSDTPSSFHGYAKWPPAAATSNNVIFTGCIAGYSLGGGGIPIRNCDANGNWEQATHQCYKNCAPNPNNVFAHSRAAMPAPIPHHAVHGQQVGVACPSGMSGSINYSCNDGNYQYVSNNCKLQCAASSVLIQGHFRVNTPTLQDGQTSAPLSCYNNGTYNHVQVRCNNGNLSVVGNPACGCVHGSQGSGGVPLTAQIPYPDPWKPQNYTMEFRNFSYVCHGFHAAPIGFVTHNPNCDWWLRDVPVYSGFSPRSDIHSHCLIMRCQPDGTWRGTGPGGIYHAYKNKSFGGGFFGSFQTYTRPDFDRNVFDCHQGRH